MVSATGGSAGVSVPATGAGGASGASPSAGTGKTVIVGTGVSETSERLSKSG